MNSGAGGFDSHALPPSSPLPDPTSVQIRPYEPGDERAILETFNRVFAEVDPGFVARSSELWRWSTLANPAGLRLRLAVDARGRVLAQYAGRPQRVLLEGAPATITQCVDSMAAPEARALSRSTLFVRTGREFALAHGGPPGHGDPFMWGFPVPAARRIGERFLGYETIRRQTALLLDGDLEPLPPSSLRAEETTTIDRSWSEFSWRVAARYGAIGERTAEVLRWRYLEHPIHCYRLAIARDLSSPTPSALLGFAVVRRAAFEGRDSLLLCDWLALPDAWAPLLAWARHLAVGRPLLAVLPPWCEEHAAFQDLGFRVRPTRLLLVGRSFDRRRDLRFWARSWYYTLGDSDLC